MKESPIERKCKLQDKVKNKIENNKNKKFKSLSELNIEIDEKTIREWRKNR